MDSRFHYSASQESRPELDVNYVATRWQRQSISKHLKSLVRFRLARRSLKRLTRGRAAGNEVFTSPYGAPHTPWPPVGHAKSQAVDIIQLHWISKFLDYTSFFGSLDPDQPVVWTLHDMNAFTGGCHFSDGCSRFKTGCGGCPQLPTSSTTSLPMTDTSREFFLQKKAALAGINLHVVAPSRWLLAAAQSSAMLSDAKSFNHIPYGISTDDYYPMPRSEARARLGIDPDVTLFCFGAMDVVNRRKGANEMLRALSHIADLPGVEGLVFGGGRLPDVDHPLPKIHQIGPVQGLLAQRTVFSSADAFVLPSLEDNLPLTGMEAMSCGTAVVGFAAGGIPDYVLPGQTGLLAKTGDADDLGRKLRQLMTDPQQAAEMGARARRRVEAEYSGAREAASYGALYAALAECRSADRVSVQRPQAA